jgi:hypothetical protein
MPIVLPTDQKERIRAMLTIMKGREFTFVKEGKRYVLTPDQQQTKVTGSDKSAPQKAK